MNINDKDPCPCGSGKSYGRCCISAISEDDTTTLEEIKQIIACNPHLSEEEIHLVIQQKFSNFNEQPQVDFFGLTSAQLHDWLYHPFEAQGVEIHVPSDLSASPVMQYLALILDEAIAQGGSFKTTPKGNLPVKIVQRANALLPDFAVSQRSTHRSISEYQGANEDNFNALHYSRILAEIAGLVRYRDRKIHVNKSVQKQYQSQGLQAFFLPMLKAVTEQYNWAYLDGWEYEVDLRTFWLFMIWRLQCRQGNVDQLSQDVGNAFPNHLFACQNDQYFTPETALNSLINSRFIHHFLEFWGFVVSQPTNPFVAPRQPQKVTLQPLLAEVFRFDFDKS